MKHFTWLATAGLLVSLAGCGDSGNTTNPVLPTGKLNGLGYAVLDGASLQTQPGALQGKGKVIFLQARPEPNSNYVLDFTLADHGSLVLSTNGDKALAHGTTVKYSRVGKRLTVVATVAGENQNFDDKYAAQIAAIDASKPISLNVDVHEHGDVVLEIGGFEGEVEFNSRPTGRYWGLVLDNATVKSAVAGPAQHNH